MAVRSRREVMGFARGSTHPTGLHCLKRDGLPGQARQRRCVGNDAVDGATFRNTSGTGASISTASYAGLTRVSIHLHKSGPLAGLKRSVIRRYARQDGGLRLRPKPALRTDGSVRPATPDEMP
jgi:hypothetical protein